MGATIPDLLRPCDPPPNDGFTTAFTVTGSSLRLQGNLGCASAQPGEPAHGGVVATRSVWFRWTAPITGSVLIYNLTTRLVVYQGSALVSLQTVPLEFSEPTRPIFQATAGQTYLLAVDTTDLSIPPWANSPGFSRFEPFDLSLVQPGIQLAGPQKSVFAANETIELVFEPVDENAPIKALTVKINGTLQATLTNSPFRFAYTPRTNGILLLEASAETDAGLTLHLLPTRLTFRPLNDNLADAHEVPSLALNLSFPFSTAGATDEPTEPLHQIPSGPAFPPGSSSVWWKWTPAYSANVRINSGDSPLFIYRGDSPAQLTTVAYSRPNEWRVYAWGGVMVGGTSFQAEAGTTYWLAAVSQRPAATAWSIQQDGHHLVGSPRGIVGHPLPLQLETLPGATEPDAVSLTISKRTSPTVLQALLQTNLDHTVTFAWDWLPAETGEFVIEATAAYPGGGTFVSRLEVTVSPENDWFTMATVIPGAAIATNLPFRTDWSWAEPDEPLAGTNGVQRSVWWKWTPERSADVRFKVSGTFGGMPLDIFTGDDLTHLIRVSHNDSRTFIPPFEGVVPLSVTAGTTYFIRVDDRRWEGAQTYPTFPPVTLPTVRTNLMLTLEPAEVPLKGLFLLSTAVGTPQQDGSTSWTIFGKIRQPDGAALASGPQYRAQFFAGRSLATLGPVGPAVSIRPKLGDSNDILEGTVSAGLSGIEDVPAGEEVLIQLRAWNSSQGSTYEVARANGSVLGRSAILVVKAGSEETGPTLLSAIQDIILSNPVADFHPGILQPEQRGENPVWKLTAPAGFIYVLETSSLDGVWHPLLILTNFTGTATFTDPRAEKGPAGIYRARLVD